MHIKYFFHEHIKNTIEKQAPTKYLSRRETELKINPWLTKGILKFIKRSWSQRIRNNTIHIKFMEIN